MKAIRKLLMGFLVSVMVLGMGLTAFAAGEGSITISNAAAGQEYSLYKVFDFAPAGDTDDNEQYSSGVYTLAENFAGFATYSSEAYGAASQFFTVGDNGILDTTGLATEDDAKNFGKLVLEYVASAGVTADKTVKNTSDSAKSVTVSGLDYGYYVIDTTLGTAIAVDTTTPSATVTEKNDVPSLDKTVTEGSTKITDLTGNDAQIGDTIEYKIVVELKKGGLNYQVVDTLDNGLTLDADNFEVVDANGADYAYTLDETTEHSFKMSFDTPAEDTTVTITYKATLNADALIYSDVNKNEAYLKYGNNTETTHKTTETKTYKLTLYKYADGTTTLLPGAVFNVYRSADGSKVTFTVSDDGLTYTVDPNGTTSEVTTKDTAAIVIKGLDSETYILEETTAPTGYNLLTTTAKDEKGNEYQHAQSVTIPTESTTAVATVFDKTGSLLPSTGGIGTTIFYILGGILIVAGVAYFIVRRKADAE
ncbi:MAG: SpaH/EbpB family LPXTG-anchored major pilin [Butyrivibrio sp.]|uniref:SpaH/EbpB family LPXTG-anchored major pilin n=1 Tax=Butyrivibrio sp. TaxID=28121 RepID=UPI001B00CFAE|nr:SpaH/EbpB family LPXTG-anchored major pilin [Butyrivibrio sp.]MBO6241078.1 SpaH/EbpB family LPXTG-anchored major pilin [Butyrivibrio sp.]